MHRRVVRAAALAVGLALLLNGIALGHEAPDEGSEWLMADWMILAFLVFFGIGLLAFIVVLRRGLLSNLEEAKYHILTIDEPDYFTPDWAREDAHATER